MRCALICSVSVFDDSTLSRLDGAAIDGRRLEVYASDPRRGAFDHVKKLDDPTKAEFEIALSDLLAEARNNDGFVFVYVASHGVTHDRHGLYLLFRDTRVDRLAATAFSVQDLAKHVADITPRSSLFVFDVCNAGGLASAASGISMDQLWNEAVRASTDLPEGHFLLGATAVTEFASEDAAGGGHFTALLLEQVEQVGQEHPYLSSLPVEMVAARVVRVGREQLAGQSPTWAGVAIYGQVDFGKNPYFSSTAVAPHHHADIRGLDSSERQELAGALRQHASALALVGSENEWVDSAVDAITSALAVSVSNEAKQSFILRAAESISRRLADSSTPRDIAQQMRYLARCVVDLARLADPSSVDSLAVLMAKQARSLNDDTRAFLAAREWLSYGPAAAGLGPIVFWERAGLCAVAALACRLVGAIDDSYDLESLALEMVCDRVVFHRIVWAGQYPDMAVTIGLIAHRDPALGLACTNRIIERLIADGSAGRRPIEADVDGAGLGGALSAQLFFGEQMDGNVHEEGPPFLLSLHRVCNGSPIEANGYAAQMRSLAVLGEWCLYAPESLAAQFEEQMVPCAAVSWALRDSDVALEAMFSYLANNASTPYDLASPAKLADMFAGACAGVTFRNRAGFGLPACLKTLDLLRP